MLVAHGYETVQLWTVCRMQKNVLITQTLETRVIAISELEEYGRATA